MTTRSPLMPVFLWCFHLAQTKWFVGLNLHHNWSGAQVCSCWFCLNSKSCAFLGCPPIGNERCARTFFAQTFWTPPGVRDIPAKFPGHPSFPPSKPREWPPHCQKVYWTKMAQNGPNDHFGQNDLIPNWILAFARPKWTKMDQNGAFWSI